MNEKEKKITILIIVGITSFITPFMTSSLNIALPTIEKEFLISPITLGWVQTSHLLSTVIFLVPFGKIADIYGKNKIFFYGLIIYTLSSVFIAISTNSTSLIFFRFLQGSGSAMIFSTNVAILISSFPKNERGKILGINTAFVYAGLSVGPLIGGLITEKLGWRSIFYINSFLGLVTTILFTKFKKNEVEIKTQVKGYKFDIIGTLIYSLSLTLFMYGTSKGEGIKLWIILLAIAGIILFILFENKKQNPILEINLFRNNPVFLFSNISALINYSATFAVGFLLSLYLQYIKGLKPSKAGLVLISQPVIMAIFSPVSGKISDKIEPRIISSIGMGITFISLVMMFFINSNSSLNFILSSLIILGFGLSFFASPNTNAVMSSVETKFYSQASSILSTMRMLGQMMSMEVVMFVLSIKMGKTNITPEYYHLFLSSLKISFMIFALMCFSGIFTSLKRGNIHQ